MQRNGYEGYNQSLIDRNGRGRRLLVYRVSSSDANIIEIRNEKNLPQVKLSLDIVYSIHKTF